ncbi:MAG: hypothetical protein J1F13_06460, partial [Prevotellaceae bacterium]|nr:hypothetical protein [Prevotellaceae bacterium]
MKNANILPISIPYYIYAALKYVYAPAKHSRKIAKYRAFYAKPRVCTQKCRAHTAVTLPLGQFCAAPPILQ